MVTAEFPSGGTRLGAAIAVGIDSEAIYLITANHLVRKINDAGIPEIATVRVALRVADDRNPEVRGLVLQETKAQEVSVMPMFVDTIKLDIAVLRMVLSPRYLEMIRGYRIDVLSPSDALQEDDTIYMLGQPQGRHWRMNGSPERLKLTSGPLYEFESALLDAGHSGGALLNGEMLILGMIRSETAPYGYAVPLEGGADSVPSDRPVDLSTASLRTLLEIWRIPFILRSKRPHLSIGVGFVCINNGSGTSLWCSDTVPWQRVGVSFIGGQRPLADERVRNFGAGREHLCAVTVNSETFCVGRGPNGQLGIPSSNRLYSLPVAVQGGPAFMTLAVGHLHTCGLTARGAVYCWGDNTHGQLGDGTLAPSHIPIRVAGTEYFRSISVGSSHSCGISFQYWLLCWGDAQTIGESRGFVEDNDTSVPIILQLTLPTNRRTFNSGVVPSTPHVSLVDSVSVGDRYTCAITPESELFCWGINTSGRLGLGHLHDESRPMRVGSPEKFLYVATGMGEHTCAMSTTGKIFCWGDNTYGQLGNGTRIPSLTPVEIQTEQRFSYLWVGERATCASTDAGIIYCWGQIAIDRPSQEPRLKPTLLFDQTR
ncbi:trypsin-like peptidase domain-containing protein [Candidatus Nitrotoga sp. 1052]|uniref:trypsin-like peptidase domain-containing protein n=1 Tax=Candidatus Nitrotoga sp. 1052 TaxID=2886964 RepID=UPI00403D6353